MNPLIDACTFAKEISKEWFPVVTAIISRNSSEEFVVPVK